MKQESNNNQEDKAAVFMRMLFKNNRRIYAYIYVLIPNQTEADDIFQETLTVMWKKFDTFIPESNFGGWGIGIAYNIVRNYRRKQARSRLRLEDDIEQLIEQEVKHSIGHIDYRIDAMQHCLKRLRKPERNVIQLRFQENYSVKEIAGRTGATIKSVYRKISQTNDMLLRCIRKTLAEQGL